MNRVNETKFQTVLTIAYWASIGGLLYFLTRYFLAWTLPLFLGLAIAALTRPAALTLTKKTRLGEKSASIISLLLFYLLAAALLGLFLTILLAQLYELLDRLPMLYTQNIAPSLDRLAGWFYGLAGRFDPGAEEGLERFSQAVSDAVRQAAVDGSAHLVTIAAGVAAKLPMLLITAVFSIVVSILTAANYRAVGAAICSLIPKRWQPRVHETQCFLRETIWKLVRAYIILLAITFVELSLGLGLLGFDYVLPVAAVIAMLDILPLVGTGTILIPWGAALIAGGDMPGGIGLLLLFGVIEVLRNILEPRIVGGQIGLHPIVTITSMYAGLKIAGFAGMLAAPVVVMLVRHLSTSEPPSDYVPEHA